ncbi:glycoside hydrolase family 24 protein [Burkholderia multivorans]|uniref:glycoside hydrolase family 24 protein n=1 Tax=Burkholderia multivorans TaxID=87883 RepID=UPI0006A65898|nr:glycoside hydrolase family 104 protein [Burkholderia multivorans]KOE26847.1 glycoside hydrolase [Burkholderia multivorans R-20526]MCA8263597.1 glycoside hydrolase family 104 protein [Burkholderia multivorans]MDN7886271.1 glycoside hydrolase family 104 protein [Burkholderia multivorans]MDN7976585.1 glycoside hydrolase family 104 protein [Burkholderia multivorans]MDN7982139.1 glycoside hydrolase family 104 protein [Burkholderia multivorans]
MARISVTAAGGRNRVAFLDMIAASEIGSALLAKSDDGYNVLVGSTPSRPLLFSSYAAHPNVLNRQIPVPSTAAGRYQILTRWWRIYQAQMKLPDFGPVSQDRYALQQLRERGALTLIDAGRFREAVAKVSNVWASLPGAGYGQHENKIEHLLAAYRAAGGEVTA